MVTWRRAQGNDAEETAARYLRRQGWQILERNFQCKSGELDIIALNTNTPIPTIAVIEVRQRSGAQYGGAAASITPGKQRKIARTTQYYLARQRNLPIDYALRFDAIIFDGSDCSSSNMQWLTDAFRLEY